MKLKQQLINLYLEWLNDFITVSGIADYYGLTTEDMQVLIEMGKKYHEEQFQTPNQ